MFHPWGTLAYSEAFLEEINYPRRKKKKPFATLLIIQQEQKLISSLDIVPANVWMDFIEPTCLRNVTNA